MKLEIDYNERTDQDGGIWGQAMVEDLQGNLIGSVTAPIVKGAAFDQRGAIIRAAVEEAIQWMNS